MSPTRPRVEILVFPDVEDGQVLTSAGI